MTFSVPLQTLHFLLVNDLKGDHEMLHALARLGQQCQLAVTKLRKGTEAAQNGAKANDVWRIGFNDFMTAVLTTPALVMAFSRRFSLANRISEASQSSSFPSPA